MSFGKQPNYDISTWTGCYNLGLNGLPLPSGAAFPEAYRSGRAAKEGQIMILAARAKHVVTTRQLAPSEQEAQRQIVWNRT